MHYMQLSFYKSWTYKSNVDLQIDFVAKNNVHSVEKIKQKLCINLIYLMQENVEASLLLRCWFKGVALCSHD